MAKKVMVKTKVDCDESIIFLEVKMFHTNFTLKEAIEIILADKRAGQTWKKMLEEAETKIHFNAKTCGIYKKTV